MANKKSPKISSYNYECIFCDYFTNKINDYDKHLTTAKHERLTNTNKKSPKVAKSRQQILIEQNM